MSICTLRKLKIVWFLVIFLPCLHAVSLASEDETPDSDPVGYTTQNDSLDAQSALSTQPLPIVTDDEVIPEDSPQIVSSSTRKNILVEPDLLAAYQSLMSGNDIYAQRLYRQILHRDVRNIDALLGMAVIAERQGRQNDARGWYNTVLELQPKNTIARIAISNTQFEQNSSAREVFLKNMLYEQDKNPNVHAALATIYASRKQWQAAQVAFAEAWRLAPDNADYVLNLAVSLDQLGQSQLALEHYRKAKVLLQQQQLVNLDSINTRINALSK